MRNTTEIKKWMLDTETTVTSIANDLGVDKSLVTRTIADDKNNRRVLRYLLEKGCPEEYLNLPADMMEAA